MTDVEAAAERTIANAIYEDSADAVRRCTNSKRQQLDYEGAGLYKRIGECLLQRVRDALAHSSPSEREVRRKMTDSYKIGYSRGYAAGQRRKWPEHRPPTPPDPIVGELVAAAQKLRDAADGELATLDPEDEWQTKIGDPMDEVNDALIAMTKWLVTPDAQREGVFNHGHEPDCLCDICAAPDTAEVTRQYHEIMAAIKADVLNAEAEVADLRKDLEAVNAIGRHYGYGQGDLDNDLAGCLQQTIEHLQLKFDTAEKLQLERAAEVERLRGVIQNAVNCSDYDMADAIFKDLRAALAPAEG